MVATQEDLEEAARQWEEQPEAQPTPGRTSHFALLRIVASPGISRGAVLWKPIGMSISASTRSPNLSVAGRSIPSCARAANRRFLAAHERAMAELEESLGTAEDQAKREGCCVVSVVVVSLGGLCFL